MSVNLQSKAIHFVDHLTGWTNIDFDTFTTSGKAISSAIEADSSIGHAWSNAVAIKGSATVFGYIQLEFYITVNSGECPEVTYYKNDVNSGTTDFGYTVPGWYKVGYLITEDDNYRFGFQNADAGASNFTISGAHFWAADSCIVA